MQSNLSVSTNLFMIGGGAQGEEEGEGEIGEEGGEEEAR